ncbi:hypothetical protein AB1Y20_004829 [Prymnesium parvum]|uniref:ABC transporter domain-containing protein n=1 Tax=Prymnesium parvum TaxID=97485 RepID=A0AB34IZ93_PRYPA
MEAREACDALLAGLDEEVLAYVVDMLQGEEDQETMRATLAAFLLSCDHCASEDEAVAKCAELFAALHPAEEAAAPAPQLRVLDKKTSLADADAHLFRDKAADQLGGRLVGLDEALETRKKRKAQQEAELRAVKAAHTRVVAQRREEEAALQAAATQAVLLRAQRGAFTGAIEAKPFSLPNPGGGRELIENATFTLVRGRIYGLIGRNGKGKSTLLRALASRAVGDIPAELTVHYVSQEVQMSEESREWTPVQVVLDADVERRLLLQEAAALADDDEHALRLQKVTARLELLDAHSAEERAITLLSNLGFSAELRGRPMSALSGGWRVRTALAAAIFAKPDLLLLDEPTNHLSIGAVLWLARELTTAETWRERTVVVVSHDRVFLDEVSTDTLHVSGAARRLTQSRGNYTAWAKRREQQQLTHAREMESKQRMIKELRDYKPLGSTPKAMKIFKSKEKQADKLEEEACELEEAAAALLEDAETPMSLKAGGKLPGFAVQVKGVSFAYGGGAPLFRDVEMGIDSSSRIVLLGENGNGKTTLVKLILGELTPTAGEVLRAGGVRIALVNQHHADQIDLTLSPLQFLMERFPGDSSYDHEQQLRSHLHSCGVSGQMQTVPSSALSGGQRSRVALAAVSYTQPHILVLDEPTNNLDLESVASLADCIDKFAGGVVLVSHDQYFVSRVAKEVWVVEKGKVARASSFDHYREAQVAKMK